MTEQGYSDYCFRADVAGIDPDLKHLIDLEEERQARRLVMIPSESITPRAVRQTLGLVFNDVYAEGYPPARTPRDYANHHFYEGNDYAHLVETLARRRAAQCFANERVSAAQIYVNVQPLSGIAVNLAVYQAFMEPGDTLMGMAPFQGSHLAHGSELNVSGKRYKVVSYGLNRTTERLDYDDIMALALEHRPRVIVAGHSSYPWAPDWEKFREIADAVEAILMADIAHPAGMVIAGVYPSPVGLADVITFTTHQTLCGPRGAVIMTTDADTARLIDQAVSPAEQGDRRVNRFAAMAVAFQIAQTDYFRDLQRGVKQNAQHLAQALEEQGLRLAHGGTDTHLLLIDLNSIKTTTGYPLRGEIAVRILDLVGIVADQNAVPGSEALALGTPWVTQRGMGQAEMEKIAEIMQRALTGIQPYTCVGLRGELPRGKIEQNVLEELRREVATLVAGTRTETVPTRVDERGLLYIVGWRAQPFLQEVSTNNVAALQPGQRQRSLLLDRDGMLIDDVFIQRLQPDDSGRDRYIVSTTPAGHEQVKVWFRNLSAGYVIFDEDDLYAKVEGPVTVVDLLDSDEHDEVKSEALAFRDSLEGIEPLYQGEERPDGLSLYQAGHQALFYLSKPYFIGQKNLAEVRPRVEKEEWKWLEPEEGQPKRTCLYDEHAKLTRKIIPFAGWEMPVWYSGVSDEHRAVRETAALFDVSHMGFLEVAGEHATDFLDTVCSNYVRLLKDGRSLYAYLFDPDGNIIDDIMVYRRQQNLYLMVVNASNFDKDWDWLNAVNERRVIIDRDDPAKEVVGQAILSNLKDPSMGRLQRVDIALQGPNSLAILQSLTDDEKLKTRLARMKRTWLIEAELGGLDLIIAQTGYCGEEIGYEIFVHPDHAPRLWKLLLEKGAPFGIKPAGLGARDSTRTEAGLPLYGHELAGEFNIDPLAAGFGSYVKLHKPYFIGRKAFIEKALDGKMQIVRFRMDKKGVRMPATGHPVVNRKGKYVGAVRSCAIDSEGYLLGLAYVDRRYAKEGTPLNIFALPHGKKLPECKPLDELTFGDQVMLGDGATVLSRFPKKER